MLQWLGSAADREVVYNAVARRQVRRHRPRRPLRQDPHAAAAGLRPAAPTASRPSRSTSPGCTGCGPGTGTRPTRSVRRRPGPGQDWHLADGPGHRQARAGRPDRQARREQAGRPVRRRAPLGEPPAVQPVRHAVRVPAPLAESVEKPWLTRLYTVQAGRVRPAAAPATPAWSPTSTGGTTTRSWPG